MYGAIIGDIIGQPYERAAVKSKAFLLFCDTPHFTDDTVMTIAVCDGILKAGLDARKKEIKSSIIENLRFWAQKYPYAGYGGMFKKWLSMRWPRPYKSFGNGAAMRVSSVGWLFDSLERTLEVSRWTAEVTHNHKEGIKGAQSIAAAIYLARTGSTKKEIKDYIQEKFKYNLSKTCDEIRPSYYFDSSCQGTCPQAITAFLEGDSFEDVIRNAISLGGDSDTIAAIAGSIAEAFFGIPDYFKEKALEFTKDDMHEVMGKFESLARKRVFGVSVMC
ncbi:MAG: ADP-ribosylglycohydrolase family protein [Treponema sp.]|nr:ADP-ribosylglycohydrolase family protein [Treponema sp.]